MNVVISVVDINCLPRSFARSLARFLEGLVDVDNPVCMFWGLIVYLIKFRSVLIHGVEWDMPVVEESVEDIMLCLN